jgi:hypothetical protein
MQFRYMGFSQQANVRRFRFQGLKPAERLTKPSNNIDFELSADMALLARYRVRVQDGPSLCLRILTFALSAGEDNAPQFASYAITQGDVAAYTDARNGAEELKAVRRKPRPSFKPSPASQLKWPRIE